MYLTTEERALLSGETGNPADRMAMEIVTRTARLLGAERLVPITSAHIDGVILHGQSAVLFCEQLLSGGAHVRVPATTNVGSLNLLNPNQCRLSPEDRKLAYRIMVAYERMGCTPSWTCAPYQAGARPGLGDQIAWAESNAVAFANTVLGARTNRYGDFLDISCAVTGRAPDTGLHRTEARRGQIVFDLSAIDAGLRRSDAFFPVLGALLGRHAGSAVPAVVGLEPGVSEDQLKAMCAGAASTGSVALTHVVGVTPEAPDLPAALHEQPPEETILVPASMIRETRDALSLAPDGPIDCVALGSPHFSTAECRTLLALAEGRRFRVPVYVCLGRQTLEELATDGVDRDLAALGVTFVADTCVVVAPILAENPGVMMTNSAKFAHYSAGNTGHLPVFGTLAECAASAQAGRVVRDPGAWQ